jgi:hypothetical protein
LIPSDLEPLSKNIGEAVRLQYLSLAAIPFSGTKYLKMIKNLNKPMVGI